MSTATPDQPAISPPRTRAQAWCDLIKDHRISHGAHRLRHALYTYENRASGLCNPGQRSLQRDLGCSNSSLKPWTEELVKAGWVSVKTVITGLGKEYHYTLLDGHGNTFPKAGTPPRSQNREHPLVPKTRIPKTGNKGVTVLGTEPTAPYGADKEPRPKAALTRKAYQKPMAPACADAQQGQASDAITGGF